MTFTGPVYLESQDQTLQRRVRVHDMFDSICNGRRKLFCIECYTRKYVRIRTSCQVQPLQQRDAHKFLTVGGKYSAQIIWYPFVSPFQCWARSDTPSSTCKFIIPPALKPKTNIETGMQGVCDTLNLCRIVSAYRCGCCFICSVHWPFVLRFGAQCATLHAKFYAEYFPPTVRNLCASLCFKRFPCYPSVAKYPALRLQCGVLIYAKYFPFEPLRPPCGMGVRSA